MAASSGSAVSAGVELSSDDITTGDCQSAVEIHDVTRHGVHTEDASHCTQLTRSLTHSLVNTQTHTHTPGDGHSDNLLRTCFVELQLGNSISGEMEVGAWEFASALNPVLSSI